MFWGVLPLALKIALQGLDPYTITWYRFAVSALVLGVILAATGRLPTLGSLNRRAWRLLAIALAGLTGNYVLYLAALSHTTPTVTQTVIQLGPAFLLLGGLVVFKERFSGWQWTGFLVLVLGLVLFFNRRLPELRHVSGDLGLGVVLLIVAALVWAAYGLAQKGLLRQLSGQQVLLLLYLGAVVVLLPPTSLGKVWHLNTLQLSMLAFSCLNTLVAYGAFAEALKHWEISRVSAVLSTAPLFTIASMWLVEQFTPNLFAPERLNALSVFGASLVVGGSAMCTLSAPSAPGQPPNGPATS